jgi:hypothetical protein
MLRSAGRRPALHHCSSLPPPSTSAAAGRPLGVGRGELVSIERRRTSAKHSRSGMGLQAGPPRRLRGHRRPPAPQESYRLRSGTYGSGMGRVGWRSTLSRDRLPQTISPWPTIPSAVVRSSSDFSWRRPGSGTGRTGITTHPSRRWDQRIAWSGIPPRAGRRMDGRFHGVRLGDPRVGREIMDGIGVQTLSGARRCLLAWG